MSKKYFLTKWNSPYGIQKDGMGNQFYSHIVDFPDDVDNKNKKQFVKDYLGFDFDNIPDMMLLPDQAEAMLTSNTGSVTIDIDNKYYNNRKETLESMLDKDAMIVIDFDKDNKIKNVTYWAVEGSRANNNTLMITYSMTRDWLFEKGINNMFRDDRDVIIERGMTDNVKNLDIKTGDALYNIGEDSDNFYNEDFDDFQDGAYKLSEEDVLNTKVADKVSVIDSPLSEYSFGVRANADGTASVVTEYQGDEQNHYDLEFNPIDFYIQYDDHNVIFYLLRDIVGKDKNHTFRIYTLTYSVDDKTYLLERKYEDFIAGSWNLSTCFFWKNKRSKIPYVFISLQQATRDANGYDRIMCDKYIWNFEKDLSTKIDDQFGVNVLWSPEFIWYKGLWPNGFRHIFELARPTINSDYIYSIEYRYEQYQGAMSRFVRLWRLWIDNETNDNLTIKLDYDDIGDYDLINSWMPYENKPTNKATLRTPIFPVGKGYIFEPDRVVKENLKCEFIYWEYNTKNEYTKIFMPEGMIKQYGLFRYKGTDLSLICQDKANDWYLIQFDTKAMTWGTRIKLDIDLTTINDLSHAKSERENYAYRTIFANDENIINNTTINIADDYFIDEKQQVRDALIVAVDDEENISYYTRKHNSTEYGLMISKNETKTPSLDEAKQKANDLFNNTGFAIIKFQTAHDDSSKTDIIKIDDKHSISFKENDYPLMNINYGSETIQNNMKFMIVPHFKMRVNNLELVSFDKLYPFIQASPDILPNGITQLPFNVIDGIKKIEMTKTKDYWSVNLIPNENFKVINGTLKGSKDADWNFLTKLVISEFDNNSEIMTLNDVVYDTDIQKPFIVNNIGKLHKEPYTKYSLKTMTGNTIQILQAYLENRISISMSYTYGVNGNHSYYKINDLDNLASIYNSSLKYGLYIEEQNQFSFVQTNSVYNQLITTNGEQINQQAQWNKQNLSYTEKINRVNIAKAGANALLGTVVAGTAGFAGGGIGGAIGNGGTAGASGLFDVASVSVENAFNKARAEQDIKNLAARLTDARNSPSQIAGNGDDMTGVMTKSNLQPEIVKEELWPALKTKIAYYFQVFGVNLGSIPRKINEYLDNRYYFNYIEASSTFENYREDVPLTNEVRQIIDMSLKRGITIWHYRNPNTFKGIKNYNVNNVETKYATMDETFDYKYDITFGADVDITNLVDIDRISTNKAKVSKIITDAVKEALKEINK